MLRFIFPLIVICLTGCSGEPKEHQRLSTCHSTCYNEWVQAEGFLVYNRGDVYLRRSLHGPETAIEASDQFGQSRSRDMRLRLRASEQRKLGSFPDRWQGREVRVTGVLHGNQFRQEIRRARIENFTPWSTTELASLREEQNKRRDRGNKVRSCHRRITDRYAAIPGFQLHGEGIGRQPQFTENDNGVTIRQYFSISNAGSTLWLQATCTFSGTSSSPQLEIQDWAGRL